MVHQRGPQAHRHHVHGAGHCHAAARLRRRHHDAPSAGHGLRGLRGLPQRASLRPDLHGPRRDHDLLRGDAARHGLDELRRAAADRGAGRLVPIPQQLQLLDDDGRRDPRHDVAVRRRVRPHRLARLSAALEHRIQPRRRSGLLHLGAAGGGRRDLAVRRQSDLHHREAAGAGHDDDEDAGLHLDRAVHQRAHRRGLSCADRRARAAFARPLRRHELLHERLRRQSDDVREPHLDLGPS